jgi:hypothetical protein
MFDVFYFNHRPNRFEHEQRVESIEHARSLSRTRYCWIINYLADYENFDFLWEPVPWESDQLHAWASQYQTDSRTYLVPRRGFKDINYHPEKIFLHNDAPVIMIDHGNVAPDLSRPPERVTRFVGSYLETLRRIVARADSEWIWVASSVCDYSGFDWDWHPSVWQDTMIHVFASDDQKFGDTFYLHVPTAREKLRDAELLDWTNLNFVPDIRVPRWPMPVNHHQHITQVPAVLAHEFTAPLEVFTMTDHVPAVPTVSLWRDRTRTVTPVTPGGTTVVVPRDVRTTLRTQLYDYAWIDRSHVEHDDPTLDVVYVSNGEVCEERNYEILARSVPRHQRVHWVRGVQGRVASQHAAARRSTTEFYFFVPAKLEIDPEFDWSWHPDMLQSPKHWIFNAYNPITGLTYGHGAMVCYCRSLVLDTQGHGIDFTLEKPHDMMPILSGIISTGGDPRTIWRTAFRETVKLACWCHSAPDVDTEHRLARWLQGCDGDMGIWSQRGAQAGLEFAKQHRYQLQDLHITYEWQCLDSMFASTYPSVAGIL